MTNREKIAVKKFKDYIKDCNKNQNFICEMNDDYYQKEIKQNEIFLKMLNGILTLVEKQDKMINAMAEYLAQVRECPYEDFEVDLNCDKRCDNTDETLAECWKMYFERKVRNDGKTRIS